MTREAFSYGLKESLEKENKREKGAKRCKKERKNCAKKKKKKKKKFQKAAVLSLRC